MKSFTVAAVAALVGGASAAVHGHGHDLVHGLEKKAAASSTCGCTTIYKTITGQHTLVYPTVPIPSSTSSSTSIETPPVVPTPAPHTCPTTGVYTFEPTTVTLTESTTVCVPTTVPVTSGTNVVGGVTTVVTTATTVTCPYASVETSSDVTTSVVYTTTYVCPSAGTYTIAPTTTYVDKDTTVTIPSVTSYVPGTYTAPAVITTVVDTSYVVYCPFDIPTPSAPAPVPTTYAAVEVPSVYPVVPEPEPTTYAAVTYVPTTTEAVPKPTYTPKAPTGGLGGNVPGMPWAITFTPYLPDVGGGCMTKDQVYGSIAAIAAAGITTIRTYSTDCDTLSFVGDACVEYGVKMIVGVFVDSPGCQAHDPSITEQIDAIAAWAQWDIVPLAVIGNEGIINGFCTPQQIADLIIKCKSAWSGYTGPYTTAETVNIWEQEDAKAALCPVVDIVGANAWAFFNTATTADQAGVFVKGQLDIIENVCPGKDGYILETGWPTAGNTIGSAVPGYAEQAAAITSIIKECGDKVTILSPFNDGWKDPNTPCACERFFGVTGALGISGLPF